MAVEAKHVHELKQRGIDVLAMEPQEFEEAVRELQHPDPPPFGEWLAEQLYEGVVSQPMKIFLARIEELHIKYHNGWAD